MEPGGCLENKLSVQQNVEPEKKPRPIEGAQIMVSESQILVIELFVLLEFRFALFRP